MKKIFLNDINVAKKIIILFDETGFVEPLTNLINGLSIIEKENVIVLEYGIIRGRLVRFQNMLYVDHHSYYGDFYPIWKIIIEALVHDQITRKSMLRVKCIYEYFKKKLFILNIDIEI